MNNQVPFISRETELDLIAKLIEVPHTRRILCIQASGGIGKTRLLQEARRLEIKKKDSRDFPLIITEIIDFDDHTFHIPTNLLRKVGEMVEPEIFDPYFKELKKLHDMKTSEFVSESLIQKLLKDSDKIFVECFLKLESRVVLFMDTTDAVPEEETDIWKHLPTIVSRLENIFLLIAGRNAGRVGKFIANANKDVDIITKELNPFEDKDSESYLIEKQKLSHVSLEPQLAQNLIFLAGGRPILLDLAVEWRARNVPLDWLLETTPGDMASLSQDQIRERQLNFEKQLVCHIAETHELTDWLFLLMALIYPLDRKMIAELLDLEKEEAEELFENARKYVFVKELPDKRISLHDVMRDLINEYVWPKVDKDGDRRRDYLELEIQSLTRRIEELQAKEKAARKEKNEPEELAYAASREHLEQDRWNLRKGLLDHIPFLDIDEKVKILIELFDESTHIYRFFFRNTLISEIEKCISRLSPEQTDERYALKNRLIKHFKDSGEYSRAKALITETMGKETTSPERQIETFIQRANLNVRLGNLDKGIADFEQAVQKSDEHDIQHLLVRSLNGLGWAFRNQGDFDQALKKYLEAYRLSSRIKDQKQTALVLNNISYVEARKGKSQSALNKCNAALKLCKEEGLRREMGFIYSTRGEIYIRFNFPEDAMRSYEAAMRLFEKEKDVEWISTVQCGQASVCLIQEKFDEAESFLNKALKYASKNNEPRILYYQGKVHWGKKELKKAGLKLEECKKCCQEIGDHFFEYASFSGLVGLAWDLGEYGHWKAFDSEHKENFGARKSEMDFRLRGFCLRNIGDLAICNGDYDAALSKYQKGFLLINQHEVVPPYTIEEQVQKTDKRLCEKAPKDLLAKLGDDLTQFWYSNEALTDNAPESLLTFQGWAQEG